MLLSGVHSGVIRIMQSDIDVSYFPTIHGFDVDRSARSGIFVLQFK